MLVTISRLKERFYKQVNKYFEILQRAKVAFAIRRKLREYLTENPNVEVKRDILKQIHGLRVQTVEEKLPQDIKTKLAYIDGLHTGLLNLLDLLGKWGSLFNNDEIANAVSSSENLNFWLDQFEANNHYHSSHMRYVESLDRVMMQMSSLFPSDPDFRFLASSFLAVTTAFKHLGHFAKLVEINVRRIEAGIRPGPLEVNIRSTRDALERADKVAKNLGMQLNLVGLFDNILHELSGGDSVRQDAS